MPSKPKPTYMLGLDPGPTSSGWCVLRAGNTMRRPSFMAANNARSTPEGIEAVFGYCVARGASFSVAIESVSGYVHEYVRSAALHETARVAGLIEGLCAARGLQVVLMPAVRWRAAVCGKSNASDALVKTAIRVLVADWPTRSNVHMRDAAGVAFAALSGRHNPEALSVRT